MTDLQFQFSVIFSPTQFVLGIFSSIISIIIFNKTEFKNQSTKTYLIKICIFNVIQVTMFPFMVIPASWEKKDLNCKIYVALPLFISEIQAWVVMLCSIDRLMFVISPRKFIFRKKLIFQFGSCAVASLIIAITIIPCIYYYSAVTDTDNQTLCSFPIDLNLNWILIYFKIQFFLFRVGIPFAIMITSNIIVSWKMYKRELGIILNPQSKTALKLAKSLVGMDIIFILTKLPMLFYLLLTNNGPDRIIYNFTYSLFAAFGNSFCYFYFLFLIIFNRIYRENFLKYFNFLCKKNTRVLPAE
jgi:hypothetical protein